MIEIYIRPEPGRTDGVSASCFEDEPVIPESEKYHMNGRVPLWAETQEPYGHLTLDGARCFVRPDISDKYVHGELTREQVARMYGGVG